MSARGEKTKQLGTRRSERKSKMTLAGLISLSIRNNQKGLNLKLQCGYASKWCKSLQRVNMRKWISKK